jgi:hypothetical protein
MRCAINWTSTYNLSRSTKAWSKGDIKNYYQHSSLQHLLQYIDMHIQLPSIFQLSFSYMLLSSGMQIN